MSSENQRKSVGLLWKPLETLPQSPTPPEKMEGGSNASNSNYILIVNVFGALGKRSRPLRGCWAGRQKEAAGKQMARIASGRNGFPLAFNWFLMVFNGFPFGFPLVFDGVPFGFPWMSFGLQWVSLDSPKVFNGVPLVSNGFPLVSPRCPFVSCGFQRIPFGFTRCFLVLHFVWLSIVFLGISMDVLWFYMDLVLT